MELVASSKIGPGGELLVSPAELGASLLMVAVANLGGARAGEGAGGGNIVDAIVELVTNC